MRQLPRKLRVWLQCLWFFGLTPRRLRLKYAELCLAVQTDPIPLDDDLYLHGDQCTSVILYKGIPVSADECELREVLALNAATYTADLGRKTLRGISIQANLDAHPYAKTIWGTVFRTEPPVFWPGEWIYHLRRALRAKVTPYVPALPLTSLKEPL